jgi:adenosylhomocysteine nucleosidase
VTARSDILVVTGAAFEAEIAQGDGIVAICSGANPKRLRTVLNDIDHGRFRAVVSFGLAGGLDPSLRPGDLVVGDQVIAGSNVWRTAKTISEALGAAAARRIRIAGAEAPVMTPAAKATLRAATRASAVDMESHVVTEFAASRNLPWGVLRAICDPAERALPAIAMAGLTPEGGIDLAATLKGVARNPLQIPALIRTGIDTAIAMRALRRAGGLGSLLARLGGADLR